MLQPGFQGSVPLATAEGAASASPEKPKAPNCRFSDRFLRHHPFASFTAELFTGVRLAYPADEGSAAALRNA